jgi:hypothetical protein
MKKYLFVLIAFSFLAGASCQEKTNVAQEEEAIKAVIKQEIALWLDQDYIAESDFLRKVDYATVINNNGNNHKLTVGWEGNLAIIKESSEADWSELSNGKFECRDFHIKVYDDVAWAVYYEQLTGEWKGEPVDYKNTKVTILEKVDGNWKLVLNSITRLDPCETEDDEDDE